MGYKEEKGSLLEEEKMSLKKRKIFRAKDTNSFKRLNLTPTGEEGTQRAA